MSDKKPSAALRQRFDDIRHRETTQSSIKAEPMVQEEDVSDARESLISQEREMISNVEPEAAESRPEIEPDEEMRVLSTLAQVEHQNNLNNLENIRRRATISAIPQGLFQKSFLEKFKRTALKPVELPRGFALSLEAMQLKVHSQDEILRNFSKACDKYADDNKSLTRIIDEMTINFKETEARLQEQNLDLAQLQNELAVNKANVDAMQVNNNEIAVELMGRYETIDMLQEELKESNLKLQELEAARSAAPSASPSPSLDVVSIQSITLKNSAADEEIINLKSRILALEKELAEANVQLEQESAKSKQIAELHSTERAEIQGKYEELAIEKTSIEKELTSEKASSIIQLEELETLVKKLKLELIESKGNFRSWLRIRPPQGTLIKQPIVIHGGDRVEVVDRYGNNRAFNFDRVFAPEADNASVFNDLSEILEAVLQGYDVTVLAYGQTGSGKTYTMSAMLDMALEQIFTQLAKSYGTDYSIRGRFIEVYEQKVYDLLKPVREQEKVSTECGGMWPVREQLLPVQTVVLEDLESVQAMIKEVSKNRTSGQTEKNDTSSRSHMFLSFHVKASKTEPSGATTTSRSGITFVDLAGSESLKNVQGRLSETQAINAELSALRGVLIAMGNNAARIPFRDTQLTRLFQDGFTGGKVLFIQAASLGELEESIHTMDFGALVSKVMQKKPAKNVTTEFAATEVETEEETTKRPRSALATSSRGAARSGASTRGAPTSRGSPAPRGMTRGRGK